MGRATCVVWASFMSTCVFPRGGPIFFVGLERRCSQARPWFFSSYIGGSWTPAVAARQDFFRECAPMCKAGLLHSIAETALYDLFVHLRQHVSLSLFWAF